MLTAVALAFILAQDGGAGTDAGVSDRPVVTRLSNGHYDFSPTAFTAIDAEMKRLQIVEATKQSNETAAKTARESEPSWVPVVLISVAVGLGIGLIGGFVSGIALDRASTGH